MFLLLNLIVSALFICKEDYLQFIFLAAAPAAAHSMRRLEPSLKPFIPSSMLYKITKKNLTNAHSIAEGQTREKSFIEK